ncbi:putative hemolysin [Volucribacter amazonae]|uniref:Hemolysin n=1 Tax=Volucribacter amazonae TaxID=256731 RepID=A0A9X4PDE0_9PAST|nr:DUF333 domain-containing protein [Volucribacter amazonae]MDG6896242.1 hypothetical protein [Volucribacter amazonae]
MMNKFLLPLPVLLLSACHSISHEPELEGLANPASVYCVEQGGQSVVKRDAQGNEYGECHLPDGRIIEEWDFYRQNH